MKSELSDEEFSSLLEFTYGGNQKQALPLEHQNKLLELGYIVDRGCAATELGISLLRKGQHGPT
jgi:hypothetical protein